METIKIPEKCVDVKSFFYYADNHYNSDHRKVKCHSHPYYEMNVILSGSMELYCENKTIQLTKNQLYFINPGLNHKNAVTSDNTRMIVLSFNADMDLSDKVYSLSNTSLTILQLLINEFSEKHPDESSFIFADGTYQTIKNLTELLILKCHESDISFLNASKPSKIFDKAVKFMWDNISEPITIADIANHCYVSPSTIKYSFNKCVNCGVKQYFNEIRLELARSMLLGKEDTIEGIAGRTGFCSISHFSKAFKQKYGVAPSKFK